MSSKIIYTDQVGRSVLIPQYPQRIISLVPSQTELLYELGMGTRVVGITKFCIYPDIWFRNKTRIGGPKTLNIDKIKSLQPDLVIGNKEENIKEQVEALTEFVPVWLSDVFNLEDNYSMINQVGKICSSEALGAEIITKTQQGFQSIQPMSKNIRVLYLIWKKPFMAVGSNTFINHILTDVLGFVNVIENQERYPVLDTNNLPEADYVFLSTEPFPFQEKHFKEVQPYFPNAKLCIVDGEFFTWYGSRLMDAPQYFQTLLAEL